jgi:arginyl-tRNA--protein-N-Asp/Glu arginylyltransferase
VTNQGKPRVIPFFRSAPMPCPYLPGMVEQQLFTELNMPDAQFQYEALSQAGFRRSHHVAYRPACNGCNACVPVRIVVDDFKLSRSWRRILNANATVTTIDVGPTPDAEQYHLFNRYLASRHADGEMVRMKERDYLDMVVSSPVASTILEFRDDRGGLIGACLTDCLEDGYSAVYSFFDPDSAARSLGSFIILSLIQTAIRDGLPYVYLGFWIEDSPKMAYKKRFQPLEGFGPTGWRHLELPRDRDPR